jgi:hypothetical protein
MSETMLQYVSLDGFGWGPQGMGSGTTITIVVDSTTIGNRHHSDQDIQDPVHSQTLASLGAAPYGTPWQRASCEGGWSAGPPSSQAAGCRTCTRRGWRLGQCRRPLLGSTIAPSSSTHAPYSPRSDMPPGHPAPGASNSFSGFCPGAPSGVGCETVLVPQYALHHPGRLGTDRGVTSSQDCVGG